MEDEIIIDTESIEAFRSNAVSKSEEILSIFDDLIKDFQTIDEKFDSKAGKMFKDKILLYLEQTKESISQSNNALSGNLTRINQIYEETNKEIEKLVN